MTVLPMGYKGNKNVIRSSRYLNNMLLLNEAISIWSYSKHPIGFVLIN
jgi:hypothetical protein